MLISSMKREVIDGRLVVGGVPAHCRDCLYAREVSIPMESRKSESWATQWVAPEAEGRRSGEIRIHKWSGATLSVVYVYYEPSHVRFCTHHDKFPCWLPDAVRFCPEFVPAKPVEQEQNGKFVMAYPNCDCGARPIIHSWNVNEDRWQGFCEPCWAKRKSGDKP